MSNKPLTMYSPDGKSSVVVLPGNVETMKGRGWTLSKTNKRPPSLAGKDTAKPKTEKE